MGEKTHLCNVVVVVVVYLWHSEIFLPSSFLPLQDAEQAGDGREAGLRQELEELGLHAVLPHVEVLPGLQQQLRVRQRGAGLEGKES